MDNPRSAGARAGSAPGYATGAPGASPAGISPPAVGAVFAEYAGKRPGQPAIVAAGRTLSYGELARHAFELALRLRQTGAGPQSPVAICVETGAEQAVAVMGSLLAGVPFHPIDPALGQPARWQRLARLRASAVVTQPWLTGRLRWPAGVTSIAVDAGAPAPGAAAVTLPQAAGTGHVACILGTDSPAGALVPVTCDALSGPVRDVGQRFGVDSADRLLLVSPLADEMSLFGMLAMLASGAAVVIPDHIDRCAPAMWVSLMNREGVTIWHSPPALAALLAGHLATTGVTARTLRLALAGGEPLAPSLVVRLRRLFGRSLRIANLGGAVAAGLWSCCMEIGEADGLDGCLPIGTPIAGTSAYALTGTMTSCPPEAVGRLYFGGPGLAAGYWDDPERSAADFVTHPATGERLYRSAQFGRLLANGAIQVIGACVPGIDDDPCRLLAIRAVEDALAALDGVLSAAVVPAGDGCAGYVKLVAGAGVTSAELLGQVRAKVPADLVPARIDIVAALPLSPSGRVDRSALAAVAGGRTALAMEPRRRAGAAREQEGPGQEREDSWEEREGAARPDAAGLAARACELAASILGVGAVEPDQNLADLGATSIQLVRLARCAEEDLGVEVDVEDFFWLPSVAVLLGRPSGEPEHQDNRIA